MAIDIKSLTDKSIGRLVTYQANPQSNSEEGRIKSWNDAFVFVAYDISDRGIATPPHLLTFSFFNK